jgi:DNA-directed RNA polymerase specialized sigma24 family protein
MDVSSAFQSIDAVARHLPFHLNDTEQANAAFRRWRREAGDADRRIVDLWTYCFVRRYFLFKFLQNPSYDAADFDGLVERAFVKVQQKQATVAEDGHYASWVSVLCKHTFLNYLRGRRTFLSVERSAGLRFAARPSALGYDLGLLAAALDRAIARLPSFLQETARLRFVEECSYDEIAAATGKPLPTIRAYVNKVLSKFRRDPHLLPYLDRSYGQDASF